jgi:hypothetical protein
MPHDDLDHIPSIIPKRDTVFQPAPSKSRAKATRKKSAGGSGGGAGRPQAGGAGIWARLFITVSLVVAAVACAWAWQLQQELMQSGHLMERYEVRISDLEDLLSDTDESMSQSSASLAAQLRKLDTEVRKLWDARKKSEKISKAHSGQLSNMGNADKATASQLKALQGDISKLRSVSGDLDRLMSSARSSQAEVERVADGLNSLNLNYSKINKRVQSNEEWVGSINAFRRQVNERLGRMDASMRAMQAPPL